MATPLQRLRTMHLYRQSLKNMLSWAARREIFYVEVGLRRTKALPRRARGRQAMRP